MQPRTSLTSNKVSAAFVELDEPRQAHTGCPWHDVRAMLRKVGLRPTRQRMELGWLLFSKGDRHLTAEMLFEEASNARVPVSLATVYNTLNQFTDVGLLRQVAVDGSKTYFDTNTSDHYHFFWNAGTAGGYRDRGRSHRGAAPGAATATSRPRRLLCGSSARCTDASSPTRPPAISFDLLFG